MASTQTTRESQTDPPLSVQGGARFLTPVTFLGLAEGASASTERTPPRPAASQRSRWNCPSCWQWPLCPEGYQSSAASLPLLAQVPVRNVTSFILIKKVNRSDRPG